MKAHLDTKTVDALLQWKKAEMLKANPEYQRGEVWDLPQKKRLVDSVLRGYPIPLIYLHHKNKEVAGARSDRFEVIDGQQRINALFEFWEGAFKAFHPATDAQEARFPSFIENQPCPWGGKMFEEMDETLQKQFSDTMLSVVMIETEESNEARDLFIRLQSGMPLNPQEKRDAWPGNFTEFILKTGGKPLVPKYPGHDFFSVVMKAKSKNRGEFRQLAAQMMMLHMTRRETGGEKLCDINGDAIDTFYYKHLDFDSLGVDAKRLRDILTLLSQLLCDRKRRTVIKHEAIHLVLLVDKLLDDYTRGWTTALAPAFDKFRTDFATAKYTRSYKVPSEYWVRYGQFTSGQTTLAKNLMQRDQFFTEKMYGWINPQLKDPTRIFGSLEREIIYYRDMKVCQVCGLAGTCHEVPWCDLEIHHVAEHSKGGQTTLENGALVDKHCHPKGEAATTAFAAKWKKKWETLATTVDKGNEA